MKLLLISFILLSFIGCDDDPAPAAASTNVPKVQLWNNSGSTIGATKIDTDTAGSLADGNSTPFIEVPAGSLDVSNDVAADGTYENQFTMQGLEVDKEYTIELSNTNAVCAKLYENSDTSTPPVSGSSALTLVDTQGTCP